MAFMPLQIHHGKNLLQLLKRSTPTQERSVELYQLLLAINDLAAAMNGARGLNDLEGHLAAAYRDWMPEETVHLCIVEGSSYRRTHLSGPSVAGSGEPASMHQGVVGHSLRTGAPQWIPDTWAARNLISGQQGQQVETLARSLMVLPLVALGRIVGGLEIISAVPGRFSEIDFHIAVLVSTHLSLSLENILTRQALASANARLLEHQGRLTMLNEQLQELAHTDEVTGLANKRRLAEQLDAEVARVLRYGEILSCLMIDVDHFKEVNDRHGHHAGDEVLRQVASLLRRMVRVTDFVARYGGEEFTILLPRTDGIGSILMAENLRSKIEAATFVSPRGDIHITVSIGIASCTKFDRRGPQQLLMRADQALYEAKTSGRNRAWHADGPEYERFTVKNLALA